MRKKVLSILLVTVIVCTVASCAQKNVGDDHTSSTSSETQNDTTSQENSTTSEESSSDNSLVSVDEVDSIDVGVDGLAQKLLSEIKFKDSMSKVDTDIALLQYNLTSQQVQEVALYLSTGATAEEIAIFKVNGENSRAVQSAIEKKIYEKQSTFKDYNPEELTKLQNPTIYSYGEYVVLCISDDDEKSLQIIKDYLSKM